MTLEGRQGLMGYLDGAGNFQTIKKQRKNKAGEATHVGLGFAIHIAVSYRDLALVQSIMEKLGGIGKIYEYPNKGTSGEAHYAITRLEDIKGFIENVIGDLPFLTAGQHLRVAMFKRALYSGQHRYPTSEAGDKAVRTEQYDPHNPLDAVSLHAPSSGYVNTGLRGFLTVHGAFLGNGDFRVESIDYNVIDLFCCHLSEGSGVQFGQHVKTVESRTSTRLPTHHVTIPRYTLNRGELDKWLQANPLLGHKHTLYLEGRPIANGTNKVKNDNEG